MSPSLTFDSKCGLSLMNFSNGAFNDCDEMYYLGSRRLADLHLFLCRFAYILTKFVSLVFVVASFLTFLCSSLLHDLNEIQPRS